MDAGFVSPRTLWLCNFAALAITALGLAEVVASGSNPAWTLGTFIAPLLALAWLRRPGSRWLKFATVAANGILLVSYGLYLALFAVAIRFSSSEPQVAGFAFMVFVLAICSLNLVGTLQRPNNSFKPKPLRGSA